MLWSRRLTPLSGQGRSALPLIAFRLEPWERDVQASAAPLLSSASYRGSPGRHGGSPVCHGCEHPMETAAIRVDAVEVVDGTRFGVVARPDYLDVVREVVFHEWCFPGPPRWERQD